MPKRDQITQITADVRVPISRLPSIININLKKNNFFCGFFYFYLLVLGILVGTGQSQT